MVGLEAWVRNGFFIDPSTFASNNFSVNQIALDVKGVQHINWYGTVVIGDSNKNGITTLYIGGQSFLLKLVWSSYW